MTSVPENSQSSTGNHVTQLSCMKRVIIPLKKQSCLKKGIFRDSSSESEDECSTHRSKKRIKMDATSTVDDDYSTMVLAEKEEINSNESLFEHGKDKNGFIVDSGQVKKSTGLKMMEKMGFKMGDTLGSNDNKTALKEPLEIHRLAKLGKSKEGLRETPKLIPRTMNMEHASEYRLRISSEKAAADKEKDVAHLQRKVIDLENFDDDQILEMDPQSISASIRQLFIKVKQERILPDVESPQIEGDDSASEDPEIERFNCLAVDEKLTQLNKYCKSKFNYCYWCGVEFEDSADIDENCPGSTKEDHEV